jgi:hypothetical protein
MSRALMTVSFKPGWLKEETERAAAQLDFLRAAQSAQWCTACRPDTAHIVKLAVDQDFRQSCPVCFKSVIVEWR